MINTIISSFKHAKPKQKKNKTKTNKNINLIRSSTLTWMTNITKNNDETSFQFMKTWTHQLNVNPQEHKSSKEVNQGVREFGITSSQKNSKKSFLAARRRILSWRYTNLWLACTWSKVWGQGGGLHWPLPPPLPEASLMTWVSQVKKKKPNQTNKQKK